MINPFKRKKEIDIRRMRKDEQCIIRLPEDIELSDVIRFRDKFHKVLEAGKIPLIPGNVEVYFVRKDAVKIKA